MAATGSAPRTIALDPPSGKGSVATQALLSAMLRADDQISQLIFSPGRPPQIEVSGQLVAVLAPGLEVLSADDTRRFASDLIGQNKRAITMLQEQRVMPGTIPDFAWLGLPAHLGDVVKLRDGMVLVTGARGSGKSSILAALLDCINENRTCHILTIEDPIEFLYTHKRATIHQRELHSDAPSFPLALSAAMHQAPKVILISELRDHETMEMALEAAETGHLVLSSVNSVSAAKAVERIVNTFATTKQAATRSRLAKVLRYIICRKLVPRTDSSGRMAVAEILKGNSRVRESEEDNQAIQPVPEMPNEKSADGAQYFDVEIEKLVRAGVVDLTIALACATDPQQLQKRLAK
ncbi:MAG: twitching motility protein [Acidobacteria bacterium]|nr:MAG: twitching motility protein [Acidobacteriota bacterium]